MAAAATRSMKPTANLTGKGKGIGRSTIQSALTMRPQQTIVSSIFLLARSVGGSDMGMKSER